MYTLDTNAIIYYLKNDSDVVSRMRSFLQSSPIYISAVTELELYSFPALSAEEARQIEMILQWIAIIPLDSQMARVAGKLRREHRLKLADSVIAATALFTGSALVTRNVRDFKHIQNLTVEKI